MPVLLTGRRGGGGGGGGGGSSPLIDLGIVDVDDLLAGPVTLYTPTADRTFQLVMGDQSDFVVQNGGGGGGRLTLMQGTYMADGTLVRPAAAISPYTPVGEIEIQAGQSFATVKAAIIDHAEGASSGLTTAICTADPVKAWYLPGSDGFPFFSAPAAWQANHAYAQYTTIHGPDNHFWAATTAGTSAGSIPDFAGNEGGTVADGSVVWTDEDEIPTQGSVHLYALVL